MASVASLTLCKELYELSGWGEHDDRTTYVWSLMDEVPMLRTVYERDFDDDMEIPAYDLGYLLRKLPPRVEVYKDYDGVSESTPAFYYAQWRKTARRGLFSLSADTPEDAAAKLAIELFKQKVLRKQSDKPLNEKKKI